MATPLHRTATEGRATLVTAPPFGFEDFFEEEHPRLFAALCLTTRSRLEAEEISQEAFVRIFERWDRVAAMEHPAGYLHRTAMNLFRKRYRRARFVEHLPIPSDQGTDAFGAVDDRDVLVRALRDLTPQQRAAVVLTAILDHSSEDAGRMLGISASTVRVLARNARTAMRTKMGDIA